MYIRHVLGSGGRRHYVIRFSRRDRAGEWSQSDVLDLGDDPGIFVHYPGGNGFYFDPRVEEALDEKGVEYSSEDLEDAFLPFLRPEIRSVVERFRLGRSRANPWRSMARSRLCELQSDLHSFDKRRLHYLRFGRVDIGSLEGREWKFLNVLLGKCRDEIEHTIELMERELRPKEIRPYLYTALELQSYFHAHLLRNHPAGLEPERVDSYFLDEVCTLNRDRRFFRGVEDYPSEGLHPYLAKYVIMYFDHEFAAEPFDDYLREYIRKRINMDRSPRAPAMSGADACRVLGIDQAEFECMSRDQLIRLYRRRAKVAHPDAGGDHEAFLAMTQAYERLLMKKR